MAWTDDAAQGESCDINQTFVCSQFDSLVINTQLYPELRMPKEADLAATPEAFRMAAIDRLQADSAYMASVEAMLRLWLSLVRMPGSDQW